jgi:hypothetical protein
MSSTNLPPTEIQIGRDPNLFEARPPADLYNRRLRALGAALGPAYVRVSGTWANSVYFRNDDAPAMATPPEGFTGVLTRAEWRGAVDFAKAVDAKLVTSFTISPASAMLPGPGRLSKRARCSTSRARSAARSSPQSFSTSGTWRISGEAPTAITPRGLRATVRLLRFHPGGCARYRRLPLSRPDGP